jgi:hypothetical protein
MRLCVVAGCVLAAPALQQAACDSLQQLALGVSSAVHGCGVHVHQVACVPCGRRCAVLCRKPLPKLCGLGNLSVLQLWLLQVVLRESVNW